MWEMSALAERIIASQGLCSLELGQHFRLKHRQMNAETETLEKLILVNVTLLLLHCKGLFQYLILIKNG
jgi:hypothetical protein